MLLVQTFPFLSQNSKFPSLFSRNFICGSDIDVLVCPLTWYIFAVLYHVLIPNWFTLCYCRLKPNVLLSVYTLLISANGALHENNFTCIWINKFSVYFYVRIRKNICPTSAFAWYLTTVETSLVDGHSYILPATSGIITWSRSWAIVMLFSIIILLPDSEKPM